MKLKKLVINDCIYEFPRLFSGDGGRVVGRLKDMYLFRGLLLGCSNAEKWCDHRRKNFFINNSVELSLTDGLIETVKYLWVNIWCTLDWIFSQNCRNSLPLHIFDQLGEEYKTLDAVVPNKFLAANANTGSYQIEEYKNSSLALILHCLKTTTSAVSRCILVPFEQHGRPKNTLIKFL